MMYGVKLVQELPSLLLILLSFLRSHQSRGGYHPPLHPPAKWSKCLWWVGVETIFSVKL